MDTVKIDVKKLNNEVKTNLENFITKCENDYTKQIQTIVDYIKNKKDIKFILLAGPSSSGKTTTAKLLTKCLSEYNFNAKAISLDDFFVERLETPTWPNGKPNYESVDAIEWQLFDTCMNNLLKKGSTIMPRYDFITGKKVFDSTLTLGKNDIIIIEGLHSLNTIIDNFISTKYSIKVYLAPKIEYLLDDKKILDGVNLRFFRRLIRDVYTRGSTPLKTYNEWPEVRLGEKLYIDSFKDSAKFTINTCHPYEVCIYKDIIKELKIDEIKEFEELVKPFSKFESLNKNIVSKNSLLQEFVH